MSKECDKWNKTALRNMINVMIVFMIITIPLVIFLYISDNSTVTVNYDFTDTDFEPSDNILINANKSIYACSCNTTFEPSSIMVYLVPKNLDYMFYDETELTQFITNIYMDDDIYHNTLISRIQTYETLGIEEISQQLTSLEGNITLKVSTDYFIMVSVDVKLMNTTFVDYNTLPNIRFFYIINNGIYDNAKRRYDGQLLIENKKLQSLTINIDEAEYTNALDMYQSYIKSNSTESYMNVPPYPFVLNGQIQYQLEMI